MSQFKCNKCHKEFAGQQALDDHNKSKHYTASKKQFNKKFNNKYFWIFFVVVLIVLAIYFIPSAKIEPGKYDEFANCVSGSGAKMYGAYWCSHCAEQKKGFGDSFGLMEYIECSLPNNAGQTQVCKDAGIQSYPTWEFGDGLRMSGVVSLEKLAEKTGCELP